MKIASSLSWKKESTTRISTNAPASMPMRVKSRLMGAVYLDNTEQAGAFGPREREFAEEHEIIRSLSEYGALVHSAFTKENR